VPKEIPLDFRDWCGRVTDCAPGRELIGGSVDSAGARRPSRLKSSETEAEIISRHGICSIIYYVTNRAIKVNSAVPESPLSRSRSFLHSSSCRAKNLFVEFAKLIVWRRPIFLLAVCTIRGPLAVWLATRHKSFRFLFFSRFTSSL